MRPLGPADPPAIGPYRLVAALGQGGMGQVFLGSGPDGRLFAVKQVHPHLAADDDFRARFQREVATSRRVSGAYTAAVVDDDAEAAQPWLASVYVPGPSLAQVLTEVGTLPEDAVLRLAAGLAAALSEIHQAGLVHRDLKPSNVLLAADGPRVIDFGIARPSDIQAGDRLTGPGWLIGTPGFMSPEQAEGWEVTSSGDMFALGAVLVAAATGRSPFDSSSTYEALRSVMQDQPDLSALSPRLRAIVEPCFAKEPGHRPSTAQLLESIGYLPPSAQPWPDPVQRLISTEYSAARMLGEVSPTLLDDGTTLPGPGLPGQQSPPPPVSGPPVSPHTGFNPAAPGYAPPFPGVPVPQPAKSNMALPLILGGGVLAMLLVVALVVFFVLRNSDTPEDDYADDSTTTEETTPWDDTITTPADTEPESDPASEFDPASLDDESTDETPLTPEALMAESFTDSKGVVYNRNTGGTHSCSDVGYGGGITETLADHDCGDAVVGTYLDDSEQIIVAVVVIPMPDDGEASDAFDTLKDTYIQDWTMWCPEAPETGSNACASDSSAAIQSGYTNYDHRYLIHTKAMYVNLTEDSSIQEWVDAAADEACTAAGPSNYTDVTG